MAYLVADATGNWTAAATWKVAFATGLLDSQAANTVLTTTFVSSAAFSPGAITVQGLCVKVASRAITPAGGATFSVRLAQAGVAVAGTTVTINVSDIPTNPLSAGNTNIGCSIGWVYFKFASPVTLAAATAYTLQASTSAANQVNLFRDATAANWSRLLVTTTTATPAAGDSMFVVGAWTGAATKTDITVTVNETASTDYGNASTILASIGVGLGGSLAWSTAAGHYVLRLSGILQLWAGATYTMGTAASPIPTGSSATLEFDSAVDGDFGGVIIDGASREFAGSPRTAGKEVVLCLLTADEAAASTTLDVDTDTGWLSGDRIVVGTTTRTRTQTEVRVLSGDAGATSMGITAGLTNAHSGSTDTQGEVALLTRNVTLRAVTNTATWYWNDYATSTFRASWTAFEYFGGTATLATSVRFANLTPSEWSFCALTNWERPWTWNTTASANEVATFTDCVWAWDVNPAGAPFSGNGYALTVERGGSFYYGASASAGAFEPGGNALCIFRDHRFVGTGLDPGGAVLSSIGYVSVEDCNFHACGATAGAAITHQPTGLFPMTVRRCRFWRNAGSTTAAAVILGANSTYGDVLFEECYFIGNTTAAVSITAQFNARVRLVDCDFESEASFAQQSGVLLQAGIMATRLELHKCRFSQGATKQTFDIGNNGTPVNVVAGIYFINTLLGGTNRFSTAASAANALRSGVYAFMEEDGISGAHETQYQHGTVQMQTPIFHTAAPSEELLPTAAYEFYKLNSSPVTKPVAQGQSVTFSVYIRKSAAYVGNQPRVVVEANGSAGWNDTVAEYVGGLDAWEEVTVTVGPAEEDGVALAYVDCDGTAGSVYVDDWSATVA